MIGELGDDMNSLAILVWVCTAGVNAVCPSEPREIAVMEEGFGPVTPYACMGPGTQRSLIQFQHSHPGLKIRRWACGQSRRGQVAKI